MGQHSPYYFGTPKLDEGITSPHHKKNVGVIEFREHKEDDYKEMYNFIEMRNGLPMFNHEHEIPFTMYLDHSLRWYYEKWNWSYDTTRPTSVYGNYRNPPTQGYFVFKITINDQSSWWRVPVLKYGFWNWTYFEEIVWNYGLWREIGKPTEPNYYKKMICDRCYYPMLNLLSQDPAAGEYLVKLEAYAGKEDCQNFEQRSDKLAEGSFYIQITKEVANQMKEQAQPKKENFTAETHPIDRAR